MKKMAVTKCLYKDHINPIVFRDTLFKRRKTLAVVDVFPLPASCKGRMEI